MMENTTGWGQSIGDGGRTANIIIFTLIFVSKVILTIQKMFCPLNTVTASVPNTYIVENSKRYIPYRQKLKVYILVYYGSSS